MQADLAATARSSTAARLGFLDGMRALAAVAVALFHFRGYVPRLVAVLPAAVDVVLRYGYLGVQAFFALSGFVIAQTLRGERVAPAEAGRFVLRRLVRLAPPYWVAVAIAAANVGLRSGHDPGRVSAEVIAAHLVFAEDVLGYPKLLDLFWTLAIEVQLYVAFAAVAAALPSLRWRAHALGITTIGSHALAFIPGGDGHGAWLFWYWYMFALGALGRMALDGAAARRWFGAAVAMAVGRALRFHGPGPVVCAAAALACFVSSRHAGGLVARALAAPPLAWLGQRSYSFYLLHALAGGAALSVVGGAGQGSAARDLAAVAAAMAASIGAAEIMWREVETRAIGWSRRVARA